MPIVRVALDVPLPALFDYSIGQAVTTGQRVVVPFGKRQLVGVVMECTAVSSMAVERIKPVTRVLHDSAPLSAALLALLNFCSDYYRYPIGQAVMSALPTRMRADKPLIRKPVLSYRLSARGVTLNLDDLPKRKIVQRRILTKLAEQPCDLAQLKNLSATAGAQLEVLLAEGWVESFENAQNIKDPVRPELVVGHGLASTGSTRTNSAVSNHSFDNAHALTNEQQRAVDAIMQSKSYGCYLLHGITGSGKTEIYVHLIHAMLLRDGQVLLLVPEINLTPQLEHYFRNRFPDVNLVSLHSGLSESERLHHWQQAQAGSAQIVLGTRLAVFAELPRLALIIVDEEHDSSFKQQDGLRYSARDVAVFRAHQHNVPVVLGSATPSLESYHNALTGRYQLLTLTERAAAAQLPAVRCVNINQTTMHQGMSENLLRAIEVRLARQEQSLLFINRRGYAPVMMCGECGWLSNCKHCASKMVLHLKDKRLRCHHCGHQVRQPDACPDCGSADLHPVGSGTQRVENVLQERFPAARILRVDKDSTRNKRTWQTIRKQIHANEVDILIGTQMLAKGHDFPTLTLVGIINPDSALYSSDFRAAEKLFAQLMQVAGRAGRADKPGEVIVQTAFPEHPLFRALQTHDFSGFAAAQLAERKLTSFPPYAYQAMLRAEGWQESAVYDYLHQAQAVAHALNMAVEIFGVVPSALARKAGHVRAQLLIQSPTRKFMQEFLQRWQVQLSALPTNQLRCTLDIDPIEF
jgi:primosomal protein N' (replication factor Y)